jgi:hypothetical protein
VLRLVRLNFHGGKRKGFGAYCQAYLHCLSAVSHRIEFILAVFVDDSLWFSMCAMKQIDQVISELATAFCKLQRHDRQLYIKALESLVGLAVSEEKLTRASSIENDMQYVGRIFSNTHRTKVTVDNRQLLFPCRRKGERRNTSGE